MATDISDALAQPMLQILPEAEKARDMLDSLLEWSLVNIFSFSTLLQSVVIVVIFLLAFVIARKAGQWLDSKTISEKRFIMFFSRLIHLSKHEIVLLLVAPSLLWFAVLIATTAMIPAGLLNAIAVLMLVWSTIRLTSGLINSPIWSKIIAILLWTIAALSIVGWLAPVAAVLDSAAITIGSGRLSLLMVFKGVMFVTVLLWITGLLTNGIEKGLHRTAGLSPSQKVLLGKVARISLFVVAMLMALNFVGIDLTALAFFSGALGIGIGFGLQKIFANLISGFILLMDKSIKPGDVIAVDNTYGWVNRLGTRYVSILTRDGKEHLIPNETMIIEKVENWSYTNDQIRLHMPINVSFKSDRKKVKELILSAVENNPRILKSPQPVCLILGFSENAIMFELRFWIDDPANGVTNIKSAVYERVWDLFLEHQIQIPHQQRDIHIRTSGPEGADAFRPRETGDKPDQSS